MKDGATGVIVSLRLPIVAFEGAPVGWCSAARLKRLRDDRGKQLGQGEAGQHEERQDEADEPRGGTSLIKIRMLIRYPRGIES